MSEKAEKKVTKKQKDQITQIEKPRYNSIGKDSMSSRTPLV
jgi:hypothetical protein